MIELVNISSLFSHVNRNLSLNLFFHITVVMLFKKISNLLSSS